MSSFIQSVSPDWIKNKTLCSLCLCGEQNSQEYQMGPLAIGKLTPKLSAYINSIGKKQQIADRNPRTTNN